MVGGQALRFDLLGLYKGVFMMRDRASGSVWAHLDGVASQGPMTGERLRFIPMPLMTWADWVAENPQTLVLDNQTPYKSQYGEQYATQTDPTLARFGDGRLPANDLVVGVEANGAFAGFPIDVVTEAGGVVNTEVGGVPVAVIYDDATGTGIAYSRVVDGQTLSLTSSGGGALTLVDDATGSSWNSLGRSTAGPLSGRSLEFVTSFISAWYGWSAYHPQTALYAG